MLFISVFKVPIDNPATVRRRCCKRQWLPLLAHCKAAGQIMWLLSQKCHILWSGYQVMTQLVKLSILKYTLFLN